MNIGVVRSGSRLGVTARAVRAARVSSGGLFLLIATSGCGPQLVDSRQGASPVLNLPAQSAPADGPEIPDTAGIPEGRSNTNVAGIPEMPASSILPRSPAARSAVYYEVQSGDSLSAIARKYGTTVDRLASDNGLAQDSLLQPGQRFFIREQAE